MQSNRDGVRANRSPVTRRAARAHVLQIDAALQHEAGAIGRRPFLHNAFENRRRVVGTQHLALREQRTRLLHRFPAADLGEELFCQLNIHERANVEQAKKWERGKMRSRRTTA